MSVATGERSKNANRVFGTSEIRRTSVLLMRDPNQHRDAIRRLKKKLRLGDSTASNNIAVAYRELGDFRRAFQWWRRTAGPKDGDAWLEVGYCLQYGIGTRRDPTAPSRHTEGPSGPTTQPNTA